MNDCCQFVCYAYGSLIGRLCIFGISSEEEIVAMETILVKRLPHQRFAVGECNAWIKKDVAQNQIQDLSEIIPNGEMCNSCISFVFFNAHAVIARHVNATAFNRVGISCFIQFVI
ncbi:hypothetical protein T12_13766, partial [Trichinella patagoniensis]